MKRLLLLLLATFAANAVLAGDKSLGPFAMKLSPDQKIEQAINRLTFGATPGELEQVRALGVERWIELQLNPERIPENPVLERRLQPLETIRMETGEILSKYFPQFPPGTPRPVNLNDLLPPEQMRTVFSGTAEERRKAILALDPDTRMKVVAMVPDNVLEGSPDLKKEQTEARQKQQEEQRMEMRRLRPPLSDLLEREQIEIAQHGTAEQRSELFASLDADTLRKVAAVLPADVAAATPGLRRMGQMSRQPQQVVLDDLREAKLYRAIYSNRQLQEILVDFWFNHFNVFEGKGVRFSAVLASYERDAIRPHILGKFRDLLLATARHPAMLYYLDNWESMSADVFDAGPFAPAAFMNGAALRPAFARPPFLARQAHGLNENYGRELLELHTIGVDGGYTQQDVINVARCFTGWTIRDGKQKPEFAFASYMHDNGEKVVLGHRIGPGGGEEDGLQVIDILAHHPSTARFISTKLARRFVADNPPPALIDRMARVFTKTDGDLREVLKTLFTSREFFSEGAWESKLKPPFEMVVSAVRALNGDTTDGFMLARRIGEMGEPLYAREAPSGYKDTADAWLSTANVMARIEFANELANGKVPGVKVEVSTLAGKDAAAMARELLGRDGSEQMLAAVAKCEQSNQPDPARIAALVLSSPEFQRR
jgi:uncharacterized protein (DUF1800 family)